MKKITLNLLVLLAIAFAWQSNAQTCDYVESGINNGTDQDGAATPIDFSCVPAGNDVTNVVVNDFTSHYFSSTGTTTGCTSSGWYDWDIIVNGSVVAAGVCGTGIEGFDYSAYAPISSVAFEINDTDVWNDNVYMDIDATLSYSPTPPPPPYLFRQDCSEEMPLEFNPPLLASAGVVVADSGFPSDTGIVGTGLGEYVLESVVINVEGEMAEDVDFFLQPAGTAILWALGVNAGGTDGMDTAVDLTFTDSSSNNYSDWTGGAPAADYLPADGAFNTALAGLDINGEWFLVVQGVGNDVTTVNSFCI
ncbi:hypothetical protein OAP72_02515, partial [Flavobacteriaceae bacterium]|nr:hypothetical protein [Flavobacteriaceae bacterium]